MKRRRNLLVQFVVLVVAATVFYSSNLIKPAATEALILPDPVGNLIWQKWCCTIYSITCPVQVQQDCFADCFMHGDCDLP